MAFATDHCRMDEDLLKARVVLDDLNSLAGPKHDEQHFAGRTRVLLAVFWPAVAALARRIEGERVEQIVVSAMAGRLDATRPLARKAKASR